MSEVLGRYAAEGTLRRLDLKPGDRTAVNQILGAMDASGRARISDLLNLLYPTSNSLASGNRSLQRLIERFNKESAHSGVTLCKSDEKSVGAQGRFIWFEGPSTWSPQTAKGALDAIPVGALVEQVATESGPSQVAIIMTFNLHETRAVRQTFTGSDSEPPSIQRAGRTYFELGALGGFRVLQSVSQQGTRAAQSTASHAIQHWAPLVLIASGIAFGLDPGPGKQGLGDVLVSRATLNYDAVRINPDGSVSWRDIPGTASDALYQRAYELSQAAPDTTPKLHLGVILTGEALVDNKDYRDRLRLAHSLAIGGEMEGSGLHEACRGSTVQWCVIKGICDWADGGLQTRAKEVNQRVAADNAAIVIYELLRRGLLDGGAEARPVRPPRWEDMGHHDAILERKELIPDSRAAQVSFDKDEAPPPTDGTPVLDAMLEWAQDSSSPQVFALLGEYGMGKTVTSQRFARELEQRRLADPTLPMPVYFDLKLIAQPQEAVTLKTTVERCMQEGWLPKSSPDFTWERFIEWLTSRRCVVIFDGLDELLVKCDARLGDAFTQRLLGVLDVVIEASRPKIVLTCRTQYFPTLRAQRNHFLLRDRENVTPDSYHAMTLLPFSDDQVRRYLAAALPEVSVDTIIEIVKSVHNLTELSHRPVTLKLIADQIPLLERRRADGQRIFGVTLYRGMAENWLDRDDTKHYLKRDHKLRLAADLAAELWRNARSSLSTAELEEWFLRWRGGDAELQARYGNFDIERLEEDLRTATFLAREDAPSGSVFRFAHTSLREYFLATYLMNGVATNRPEVWAMPVPSAETLEFVGQLLAEADSSEYMSTLASWSRPYRSQVSELLLRYSLRAHALSLPVPSLRGLSLPRANLDDLVVDGRPHAGASAISLAGADFSDASLRRATFGFVDLRGANFENAVLTQATFHEAAVKGCRWGSIASGASWGRDVDAQAAAADGKVIWGAGHVDVVTHCAWSPNDVLATASADGTARIWDPDTGMTVAVLSGHDGAVTQCAWSPDGTRLATASHDGTIRIWNPESRITVAILKRKGTSITHCAWSIDGSRIATICYDGDAQIWNSKTGAILHGIHGKVDYYMWSPKDNRIVIIGRNGTATIYDGANGRTMNRLIGHSAKITSCSWSPDGSRLVTSSDDGTVKTWNSDSGALLASFYTPSRKIGSFAQVGFAVVDIAWSPLGTLFALTSAAGAWTCDADTGLIVAQLTDHFGGSKNCSWSPDGSRVAIMGVSGVQVCHSETGMTLWRFTNLAKHMTHAAWSSDGTRLAIIIADGTGSVLESGTGKTLTRLAVGITAAVDCSWSPDGKRIATITLDNTARIWNTEGESSAVLLTGHGGLITRSAWSPSGGRFATSSTDNTARIWTPEGGQAAILAGHRGPVTDCAWSPDGTKLATTSSDETARIWDTESGKTLATLGDHKAQVLCCSWSASADVLATGDELGGVIIWSLDHPPLSLSGAEPRAVVQLAWSPDGALLATANADGNVHVWEISTRRRLKTLEGHPRNTGWTMAWSPDSRLLATSSAHTVRIWGPRSRDGIASLIGHTETVLHLAWSPDGTRLATASEDRTARIWDIQKRRCVGTLGGHHGSVSHCAWSPDGLRLLTSSHDGTAQIWSLMTQSAVRVMAGATDPILGLSGSATWRPNSGVIDRIEGVAWRWLFVVPTDDGRHRHVELDDVGWEAPSG